MFLGHIQRAQGRLQPKRGAQWGYIECQETYAINYSDHREDLAFTFKNLKLSPGQWVCHRPVYWRVKVTYLD